MSSSDNILAGLAGALEGLNTSVIPFVMQQQKAKLEDALSGKREEKQFAKQKELAQYESDLRTKEKQTEDQTYYDIPSEAQNFLGGIKRIQKPLAGPVISMLGRAQTDEAKSGTKQLAISEKQEQFQERLYGDEEKRFDKILASRSGGIGMQDAKVNAAIHSRNLIEGARDPKTGKVELNQIISPELALSLSNIVSGATGGNVETFKAMQPAALSKTIKEKLGYITGKPVDVIPKEWTEQLIHMLDRQGTTSEDLRDKYFDDLGKTMHRDLSPDRKQRLIDSKRGSSYRETFKIPKNQTGLSMPTGNQPQGDQIALPADKAARLQELRAKKAAGSLR